ncbi:hypothetical protein TOPH_01377 [Tolypocladium ophioglossoides CBS 100239]|uniref:Uncharacterized protein n=1 Tax=Tolypocladium ophioglossoides (strain CBS 100239) TaxID=1163406 RepID=A0A0L0NIT0_TOLOC|nr:hypothetical protein TOPH_01377 [Tolypocladium ophioglossoides CBS 100239]
MFRRPKSLNGPRQLRVRPLAQHLAPAARHQSSQASQASRIDRIISKLPRRLQKYTNDLRNAPVSHVVSFLMLHELTAIVPLFALFAVFHYTTYVPISYMTEHFGEYVRSGVAIFEKFFRRKRWFGFGQEEPSTSPELGTEGRSQTDEIMDRWRSGDSKYEILMEVALAYSVTKALLPIRIIGSVWATPWFAGVLMRAKRLLTRKP